jgi:hypothetical protein
MLFIFLRRCFQLETHFLKFITNHENNELYVHTKLELVSANIVCPTTVVEGHFKASVLGISSAGYNGNSAENTDDGKVLILSVLYTEKKKNPLSNFYNKSCL